MMALEERERTITLAKMEIENKMLGMELGLASLDYRLKRAVLSKATSVDEEEDAIEEPKNYRDADSWESQWGY